MPAINGNAAAAVLQAAARFTPYIGLAIELFHEARDFVFIIQNHVAYVPER